MIALLADFVLLIVILICLITDLRERKIYNKVVFPAVAAGIILNTAHQGYHYEHIFSHNWNAMKGYHPSS
jgi:Flp pilus assembly protein protease CpaA